MAAPKMRSAAPLARHAHAVLSDKFLLQHITSFQSGLPRDLVELARERRADYPKYNVRPGTFDRIPGGLLPTLAIKEKNLPMLKRLYRYIQEQPVYQTDPRYMTFKYVWRDSLQFGNVAIVEWVASQPSLVNDNDFYPYNELKHLFDNPDSEVALWLFTNRPELKANITTKHLQAMVSRGDRLHLFRWLEENVPNLRYSSAVMDAATVGGRLDLVQYLHEHRSEGCTQDALYLAARYGHLNIVRFLHENRTEGCTTRAMDWAAIGGHLDVVRFLHEHRTEGCTAVAMNLAGNLEIVRFLHDHRTEGCTTLAMDRAARGGSLDIVRFLHENRTEGCTTNAMDDAASGGHLDIVRFLHENRSEGCTTKAMDGAATEGHLTIVQYLHENRRARWTTQAFNGAAEHGHLDVLRFLSEPEVSKSCNGDNKINEKQPPLES